MSLSNQEYSENIDSYFKGAHNRVFFPSLFLIITSFPWPIISHLYFKGSSLPLALANTTSHPLGTLAKQELRPDSQQFLLYLALVLKSLYTVLRNNRHRKSPTTRNSQIRTNLGRRQTCPKRWNTSDFVAKLWTQKIWGRSENGQPSPASNI